MIDKEKKQRGENERNSKIEDFVDKKSNPILLFLFVIAPPRRLIRRVARGMMFAVSKTCLQDRRENFLRRTET